MFAAGGYITVCREVLLHVSFIILAKYNATIMGDINYEALVGKIGELTRKRDLYNWRKIYAEQYETI